MADQKRMILQKIGKHIKSSGCGQKKVSLVAHDDNTQMRDFRPGEIFCAEKFFNAQSVFGNRKLPFGGLNGNNQRDNE